MEARYQLHATAALTPGKEPPVPNELVAGWDPISVWTLWRREKSCTAGNPRQALQDAARRWVSDFGLSR
jgi:hypothetical protein